MIFIFHRQRGVWFDVRTSRRTAQRVRRRAVIARMQRLSRRLPFPTNNHPRIIVRPTMELPHLRTSPPPSPPLGLPRELDFQLTTEAVDSAAPAVRSTSSNTTLRAHAARTPSNPFRYINISPLQHTPKDSLFRRTSSSGSSLSLFAGGGGGLAAGGAGAERFGLLSPFSGGEPDRQWVYPESSLRNDRDLSMRGLSSGDTGIPPEAVFGPISFARTLTVSDSRICGLPTPQSDSLAPDQMMPSNPSPNFLSHQWSTDIPRDPDINEDDTALALESWSVNPPTPPYPNAPYMQRVPSSLLPLAPPFYSLEDLPRRLSIASVASSSPFEADWMPSSPDEQPTSPIADDLARSLQDPLMGLRSGVSDVGHAYNESIQASWRPQRFESSQLASVSRHEPAHLSPSTVLHLASWAPTSVASSSSQPTNRRKRTIAQSPSPPPPNEASSHPSSVTQRANSDSPLARTRPSRRVSRKKTFVSSPPSVSRGPKTRSRTSHERSKKAMVAENDPPAAPSQTIPSIILQRPAPIAPLSFARDASPVLSFPSRPRQSRPTLLDLLSAPPTNSSSASSSLSSTLTLLRDSPSRSSLDASSSAEPSPIPTFSPSPSASPEPSLPFYGEAGDDDSGAGRAPRDGDRKFPSGVQLEPDLNRLYRQCMSGHLCSWATD